MRAYVPISSYTPFLTIQNDQYWTVEKTGNQEEVKLAGKPTFINRISQAYQFARVLTIADKATFVNDDDAKKALVNISSRYHHLTERMNILTKIIVDVVLWIIGYRGENSLSAMGGRIDTRLKKIEREEAIRKAHDLTSPAMSLLPPGLSGLTNLPYQKNTLIPMPNSLARVAKGFSDEQDSLVKKLQRQEKGYESSVAEGYEKKLDEIMKIGYGFSLELLAKIPDAAQKLKDDKQIDRTAAELLKNGDTYYRKAALLFPRAYLAYVKQYGAQANLFDTEGTKQNSWKKMYQDYYAQLRVIDGNFDITKEIEEDDKASQQP